MRRAWGLARLASGGTRSDGFEFCDSLADAVVVGDRVPSRAIACRDAVQFGEPRPASSESRRSLSTSSRLMLARSASSAVLRSPFSDGSASRRSAGIVRDARPGVRRDVFDVRLRDRVMDSSDVSREATLPVRADARVRAFFGAGMDTSRWRAGGRVSRWLVLGSVERRPGGVQRGDLLAEFAESGVDGVDDVLG